MLRTRRGISLVEFTVAAVMSALVIMAAGSVWISATRSARDARTTQVAMIDARAGSQVILASLPRAQLPLRSAEDQLIEYQVRTPDGPEYHTLWFDCGAGQLRHQRRSATEGPWSEAWPAAGQVPAPDAGTALFEVTDCADAQISYVSGGADPVPLTDATARAVDTRRVLISFDDADAGPLTIRTGVGVDAPPADMTEVPDGGMEQLDGEAPAQWEGEVSGSAQVGLAPPARRGARALVLQSDDASSTARARSRLILSRGDRLAVWMRAGGGAECAVEFIAPDGAVRASATVPALDVEEWRRVVLDLAGTSGEAGRVRIRLDGAGAGGGVCRADSLSALAPA